MRKVLVLSGLAAVALLCVPTTALAQEDCRSCRTCLTGGGENGWQCYEVVSGGYKKEYCEDETCQTEEVECNLSGTTGKCDPLWVLNESLDTILLTPKTRTASGDYGVELTI